MSTRGVLVRLLVVACLVLVACSSVGCSGYTFYIGGHSVNEVDDHKMLRESEARRR